MRKAGVTAAPRADKATLVRRAYLDLIGLPPTPAEIAAFVNDPRADASEKVIDRLLETVERTFRHEAENRKLAFEVKYNMSEALAAAPMAE